LELDLAQHRATVSGRDVTLTTSEFRLLVFFVDNAEQVLSRQQVMEHLWSSPYVGDARACDVHISNLRRKIERVPARPERIVTVRGAGYKLTAGSKLRS
jgi:DNA-binding response OmpR family regulator